MAASKKPGTAIWRSVATLEKLATAPVTTFLDGVDAYNRHVMVLRDGMMRGGGGFYYTVGSYTCSDGKWKGEMTSREHSPISVTYPWARKVLTIGFTGTYSDDGAEFEATALAGKQSFRFKSVYSLLFAD